MVTSIDRVTLWLTDLLTANGKFDRLTDLVTPISSIKRVSRRENGLIQSKIGIHLDLSLFESCFASFAGRWRTKAAIAKEANLFNEWPNEVTIA